ncbi:MAG: DinB family protein [Candidatus Cloacimonetes bacterium]|nr:DinB family protein [Candidatus Cloacimonadota bacterium]
MEKLQKSIKSVKDVFSWVKDVRQSSHEYIESLKDEDYFSIPQTSEENLSVAHWLYITAAHTALHIGRIQLLRSIIENSKERAC